MMMIMGMIAAAATMAIVSIVIQRNCMAIAERVAKSIVAIVTIGLPEGRKRAADEIYYDILARAWDDLARGTPKTETALLILFHALTVLFASPDIRRNCPSAPLGLPRDSIVQTIVGPWSEPSPEAERIIKIMARDTRKTYDEIMGMYIGRSFTTRERLIAGLVDRWLDLARR